jgi:energy-coupling factor transport system ATP-binding protein
MYIGANDHFVTAHASIRALLGASVGQSRTKDAWDVLAPYLPGKTIDSDPGTLSFGQRHLLAIFVLMAQSGQAVVLDEPDKGLDERAQGLLIHLICAYLAAGGAVALASHNAAFLNRCQAEAPLWQAFDIEVAQ